MTGLQNIYINTKEQVCSGAGAYYSSVLLVLWWNGEPSESTLLFVVSRFITFSWTWWNPQMIPGAEWFNRGFIGSLHHTSVGGEKYEQLTSTTYLTLLNKCQTATEVRTLMLMGRSTELHWMKKNTIKQLFLFLGPEFLPTSRAWFRLKRGKKTPNNEAPSNKSCIHYKCSTAVI